MPITIAAIYEEGVLKLAGPLPFSEHEMVKVIVQSTSQSDPPTIEEAERIVRRSYGLIGWTGDLETLRRIAEDPEFSILESP